MNSQSVEIVETIEGLLGVIEDLKKEIKRLKSTPGTRGEGRIILAAPGSGKTHFVERNEDWEDADYVLVEMGLHSEAWHNTHHTDEETRAHYKACDRASEILKSIGVNLVSSLFWEVVPDAIVMLNEKTHRKYIKQRSDLSWDNVKGIRDYLLEHAAKHDVPVFDNFEEAVDAMK